MNLVAACPYALSVYYRDDMVTKRGTRTKKVLRKSLIPRRKTQVCAHCVALDVMSARESRFTKLCTPSTFCCRHRPCRPGGLRHHPKPRLEWDRNRQVWF